MAKKQSTGELSVIIPYRDFENLINSGKRIEEMEERCKRMEEKYVAMMEIYREMLDKITEINRYL